MANEKPTTPEAGRRIRVDTQITLGIHYLRQSIDAKALEAFDLALAETPEEQRALMGRAIALARLGRFDEALAGVEVMGADTGLNARAYNTRGTVYEYMGRYEEAQADFERALVLEPEGPAHYYNYACYWARRGDAERCRVNLARALSINPASHIFAATDTDFAGYRNEEWFRELVAFKIPGDR